MTTSCASTSSRCARSLRQTHTIQMLTTSIFFAFGLQDFLRSKSLPVSGVKAALVERVAEWMHAH